jgi:type VI secretion system protein ImpA
MDLEALLSAREEDNPSGEDLEYDQDFTEMELAALPGEEKQAGDEFIPAEDPDYKEVSAKALAVLERSHDLRAGVFLANSELRLRGIEGFADVTGYLRGVLEQHWGTCHPELDEDDDNDPTMRVNSILALADNDTVLRSLKQAPLTDSRTFGRLSLRHISVASGEITPPADMENVPDMQSVSAAFQDTDDELLDSRLSAARSAVENVEAINAVFDSETPGLGPDLDPLVRILKQISNQLAEVTGGDVEADVGEESQDDGGSSGAASSGSGGGGAMGAINSPNDVQNALDRIIAYYQRVEPSSPVPILLVRAKRLVGADFLSIMNDMAPNGVDNVNLIGGIEEDGY